MLFRSAGEVMQTPVREVLVQVRERTVGTLADLRGGEKKTQQER